MAIWGKGRDAAVGRRRKRRWLRVLLAVTLVLIILFAGATARLFVWPRRGMPAHVDGIVMLNGAGQRLDTALGLAWSHRARYLVVSRGSTYWGQGSRCAPSIPRVTVICFDPNPSSTQGEAEFVGRVARQYHWHSLVLVTTPDQDTRARIRVERCFSGEVYAVTTHLPSKDWPYAIVYEWGATIKAELLQRSC
jgi:hypothetical protein